MHPRLSLVLLVLLTCLAHQPSLVGGFIWDDDDYVTENRALADLAGLRDIWLSPGTVPQYYPLVHTTFWLERQLWGLNPLGYRLVNLLLHLTTAILLWLLLRRLHLPGAWLAAAIFAIHPVHVESVAWITERKNLLSGCLMAGGLLSYLHFAERRDHGAGAHRWYALALALYVGALLSKTVVCSMPAVLLVMFWWQRRPTIRGHALRLLPLFAIGLGLAAVTVWMERVTVGARGAEFDLGFPARCLIAGKALWFYAGKLLWPLHLSFVYPRWTMDPASLLPWLWPLAWLALLSTLVLQQRTRGAAAALMIFSGMLLPALGFIDVYPMRYSFVADHFQYHASAAFIALAACLAATVCKRSAPALQFAASLLWLLPLLSLSRARGPVFASPEALWTATLQENPSAWIAHNNLGLILDGRGEHEAAIGHFRRVITLKPDHYNAFTNLGRACTARGTYEEAARCFQRALELKPGDHRILLNLGNLYAVSGRREAAIATYQRVAALAPALPDPLINLGNLHAEAGRFDEAESCYRQALAMAPSNVAAHQNLGHLQRRRGDTAAALDSYSQALAYDPENLEVRYDRATTYAAAGEIDAAIADYRELLSREPRQAAASFALGCLLDSVGRRAEAAAAFRQTLAADPRHAKAHNNLGVLLATAGNLAGARQHYQSAVEVQPDNANAQRNLADLLASIGELTAAVQHYRAALQHERPPAAATKARLAWVLATAEQTELRLPVEALALATSAAAETPSDLMTLDALAAAQAATGDFSAAVETASRAEAAARKLGAVAVVEAIAGRRARYAAKQPYFGPVPW